MKFPRAAEAALLLVASGQPGLPVEQNSLTPFVDRAQVEVYPGGLPSQLAADNIRSVLAKAGVFGAVARPTVCPPSSGAYADHTEEAFVEGSMDKPVCVAGGFSFGDEAYVCPNGNLYSGNYDRDCGVPTVPEVKPTVPPAQVEQAQPVFRLEGNTNWGCLAGLLGLGTVILSIMLVDRKRHPR